MSLYTKDLVERATMTFIEAFAGSLAITGFSDSSTWYAALGSGVAAVLALAKGLIAKGVGEPDSASLSKDV